MQMAFTTSCDDAKASWYPLGGWLHMHNVILRKHMCTGAREAHNDLASVLRVRAQVAPHEQAGPLHDGA